MTDTENKSEQAAAKDKAETAPYMKKDSTPESSKSNIVMPMILLIVAVIVIVATFYKGEFSNLVAESTPDVDTSAISSTEEPAATQDEEKTDAADTAMESAEVKTVTEETVTQAADTASEAAADTVTSSEIAIAQQQTEDSNDVVAIDELTVKQYARNQAAYNPYQYHPGFQNPAKSHTQEQAQKYNELMQQRRLAYEKEMETRRQQYEAAMKAQQKKREEMIAAQRAEFQLMEKNRQETNKKIQELHNQISELHKQIHQLMMESLPEKMNPTAQ